MNIEKFYTKEVEIYENAKKLNDELDKLESYMHFIQDNYDSNIITTIEVSSDYNFNSKVSKNISLPIDVILNDKITKNFVLSQIDLKIKAIIRELKDLEIYFDKLQK